MTRPLWRQSTKRVVVLFWPGPAAPSPEGVSHSYCSGGNRRPRNRLQGGVPTRRMCGAAGPWNDPAASRPGYRLAGYRPGGWHPALSAASRRQASASSRVDRQIWVSNSVETIPRPNSQGSSGRKFGCLVRNGSAATVSRRAASFVLQFVGTNGAVAPSRVGLVDSPAAGLLSWAGLRGQVQATLAMASRSITSTTLPRM